MSNETLLAQPLLIRLKTGDDLVSQMVILKHDDIEEILLINPLKIEYMHTNTGFNLLFIPWVFNELCSSDEFVISKTDILFIKEGSERLTKKYYESLEFHSKEAIENTMIEETEEDVEDMIPVTNRTLH